MPFTNCVRELRKQTGDTQEELARKAKLSRLTVNYIENGTVEPTAETMFKIAQALNVRVEDVFQYVDHKPASIKQKIAEGVRHAAVSLGIAIIGVVLLYAGVAAVTVTRADHAIAAGNYQDAQMLQFSAESLLHPWVTHARYEAMNAAAPLHVGVGRGYLSRVPSVDGCQRWINRYQIVAQQSPYNDVFGWWLHRDLVDCLDRVGATQAAFDEHHAIIAHPSWMLARTAVMDYYDYQEAALSAHLMHNDGDARMLLAIARTDHPDIFQRSFRKWPHGDPMPIRMLRSLADGLH